MQIVITSKIPIYNFFQLCISIQFTPEVVKLIVEAICRYVCLVIFYHDDYCANQSEWGVIFFHKDAMLNISKKEEASKRNLQFAHDLSPLIFKINIISLITG